MTIKEIAKLAQVSSAAVSRYMNGGYVSEEKKERILCTAWRVCDRSTGGSRRNGDGFSGSYHGSSWI